MPNNNNDNSNSSEKPSANAGVKNSQNSVTDYMCQEEREEEDLPGLKAALTHRYNDWKTT